MSPRRPAPPHFSLQFELEEILALAKRYSYPSEGRIVDEIAPAARERGHFTRSEFIDVCGWKTERSKSRVAANSEAEVVEATRLALGAEHSTRPFVTSTDRGLPMSRGLPVA